MIYFNGDSYSYYDPNYQPGVQDIDNLWPAVVAKELGEPYINESMGCGSNSRIFDCLENYLISGNRPSLAILGLTTFDRFHIPYGYMSRINYGPGHARIETTNKDNREIEKFLTSNYNELDAMYRYYRTIWELFTLCEKFKVKVFMFQMWDYSIAERDLLGDDEKMVEYVNQFTDDDSTIWIPKNRYIEAFRFFKQCKSSWNYNEKVYDIDSSLFDTSQHPNEIGHKKIADYVLQCLKDIK